uniref:Uncharacterized protein n=1 Tax=Tanacetum cinerariifolium TaxID=118510 RepID=A0A6L2MY68_TANCI|nr:hypothetical protein [Tanacetum cinerariifolium]
MILFGAENRPPMLVNDLYDSWKSKIELYMQNREHKIMILESVENGPLIWPTIEENRVTRTKKYAELSVVEKIQADFDLKATNIIFQGLAVLVLSPGDDRIICLNKAMAFVTTVASSRFPSTNNQLQTSSNLRNQATIQDGRVTVQHTEDLDTYDSDCDDISNAKAVRMANISIYGSDVISEEKANKDKNNELVTTELERYKERVKTFKQRLNIDLSSREKMIDSQMDDMIKEKLALKEQADSLEQNLSKQIKEKECLLQTFTAFKRESKEKEDKNIENEIDLEKR